MTGTTPTTEWPSTPIPSPIKTLLNNFFTLGDSKSEDSGQRLSKEVFTPTGQIMVNKKVITAKEIATSNHGMPPGLKSRRHEVQKIYSCNDAGDDLMLIGNVHWTFDDGQALEGNFSARAVVETAGQEGGPRLKLYQGWADLSELMGALKGQ